MASRVSVITLNWNGWEDTVELLESLRRVTYRPLSVVVVENASTDSSVSKLADWLVNSGERYRLEDGVGEESTDPIGEPRIGWGDQFEFSLLKSHVNLGFCGGNNLGMKFAFDRGAELALVLNNDTLVNPDFLAPMAELFEKETDIGLVGGLITHCSDPEKVWWAGGTFKSFLRTERRGAGQPVSSLQCDRSFESDWISGCMTMIPKHVFDEIGGFDQSYFIWSEEWDLSMRVRRAGYRLMVDPRARICHKVGHSLGVMQPLNYYYGIRNGLIFKSRFLPGYAFGPYLVYYLFNRAVRYLQLLAIGRRDLVSAGLDALFDFFRGTTGKWPRQP